MKKLFEVWEEATRQSFRYVILGAGLNLVSLSISTALCAIESLQFAAPVSMLISATAVLPLGYVGSTHFVYRVRVGLTSLRRYAIVYFSSLALLEGIALALSLATSVPETLIPLIASAIGFSVSIVANTLWSFSKKPI